MQLNRPLYKKRTIFNISTLPGSERVKYVKIYEFRFSVNIQTSKKSGFLVAKTEEKLSSKL